jgi:hypothetical protein
MATMSSPAGQAARLRRIDGGQAFEVCAGDPYRPRFIRPSGRDEMPVDENGQSRKNEVHQWLTQQHRPAAHLFGIVGQIVFLSRQPPGMYQIGDV